MNEQLTPILSDADPNGCSNVACYVMVAMLPIIHFQVLLTKHFVRQFIATPDENT